LVHCIHF